ncbi:MAG: DUF47 domain-containing protein [Actinomycetes bacterium]
MRLRLSPRENAFYGMFSTAGDHLVSGAALLKELLGTDGREGREALSARMRDVEHAGDETTHEILRLLNATFVTPFDREDIYELASRLDDVLDYMEAAVDLVVLYQIEALPKGAADQIAVLERAAELTADAMPKLRAMSDLSEYWIEINRLENQADAIYRRMVAEIFAGGYDAITIIKLKEFAEALEAAADAFEDLANTIETIAVKES